MRMRTALLGPLAVVASLATACGDDTTWVCVVEDGVTPEYVEEVGCHADFLAIASRPVDASIPGARSAKTIVDREGGNTLTYQNSNLYPTHYEFASTHLSGNGRPIVEMLASFNTTEYFSPSRRFLLGALTHYEQPDKWVYEISPYDTADAAMVTDAYRKIVASSYPGSQLYFHPTSEAVEAIAADLPADVRVITTDELYAGVDYQALNPADSYGQLRFVTTADLESGSQYVSFRDIAVLDHVTNDFSVTMGIITAEFQTPLSHINVLSKNRGTPNMGLRGAFDDPALRALEGKWVHLTVDPFEYTIEEVSKEEADAWWESHRPDEVLVPGIDLSQTDLRDDVDLLDVAAGLSLRETIKASTRAFGGKAAHFGGLTRIDGVPLPEGFAIPIFYYRQFMEQHGFDARVDALIADPDFQNDPATRDLRLTELRADMMVATVDPAFEAMLLAKLAADYPGVRMRFRSSTNSEDLDGFTGAGLYTSVTGDPADPDKPVLDAIREVWACVWTFKAFEERSYRGIDHLAIGMAMLVHRSFPEEEANGVAITSNPYDPSGLSPAFYINAQLGGALVVRPDPGVTTDQLLLYHQQPGQPVSYLAHSNLIAPGTHVLSDGQVAELGAALDLIHEFFAEVYGPSASDPDVWYAMEVDWKLEGEPGEVPALYIKQARPLQ